MNVGDNNIKYEFIETARSHPIVNYDDLLKEVNEAVEKLPSNSNDDISMMMNDYVAQELHYNENFTVKQLNKIAEYYEISKRKKKKCQLIEEIVLFENSPDNHEIVSRRVMLWEYLEEIKKDKYLSKFLILD